MNIVIVVPAYQAGKTIEEVFERIPKKALKKINQFIIINDGSTDDTAQAINKIINKYKKIKVLNHEKNKGYGAVQKTGFNQALKDKADISVLLHSDGQYPPELLLKLIKPLEDKEADIVTGSRILGKGALKGGMPLYKYLGNRFLTFIENLAYGMDISEYHTGYMLYSKKALETIKFNRLTDSFHFDGEMIMMAGKKKLRITEIPIPTTYAQEKSHLKPFKYGFTVLKIILRNFMGKYDF